MRKSRKGFWPALEHLEGGAVKVEWQEQLGPEAGMAWPLLRPVNGLATTYPCTNLIGCDSPHHVMELELGRWFAVCGSDENCPPITLQREDLVVYGVDTGALCDGVARCLTLDPCANRQVAGVRAERLGTYGAAASAAFLMFPGDSSRMMREVDRLFNAQPEPFILLTPTGANCSPDVESMLRRQCCLHIPLARFVSLGDHGSLTANPALQPVLANFAHSLAAPSPHRTDFPRPSDGRGIEGEGHLHPSPKYALHKGGGYWTLVFDGQQAAIKHEKGVLYVAWLLTHPPPQGIHAIDLAAQVPAIYRRQLGITSAVDEATGKTVAFAATAMPQERSHAADDLKIAQRIRQKEKEWEAVLDTDSASEPEKAEALRKLEELAEFQRTHAMSSKGNADKLVRAVRLAITRFHSHLAAATDSHGQPHPVLRAFAEHLAKHLITPSARFNGRMGSRTRAGVAGRFTYEPPEGVMWSD